MRAETLVSIFEEPLYYSIFTHLHFIDIESSIEAEDKEVKGIDIDGVKVFNSSTVRLIAHLPSNMTWQQGNKKNLLKNGFQ
jgi:hypothetical protein